MAVQRVAIVNSKGGVGKTTSVVCLAGALRERGLRVLVVDIDPQATSSTWLGARNDGHALLEALLARGEADLLPLVHQLPTGFDVIPCGVALTKFDSETAQSTSRFTALRKALTRLPSDKWDYVLIDTPGSFGVLAVNSLVAADFFLVPIEAAMASAEPLLQQFQSTEEVRQDLNPGLKCIGILACRFPTNAKNPSEVLSVIRQDFPHELMESVIRQNIYLAQSVAHRTDIITYMPKSNGADDYRRAAAELVERVGRYSQQARVANA